MSGFTLCQIIYHIVSRPDIHQALKRPEIDMIIKRVSYQIVPIGDKEALMDLLNGNVEGFILERLRDTTQAECVFRVRDDQTTVSRKFVIK